jgi:DNA-binding IclR family transcriptional regulator
VAKGTSLDKALGILDLLEKAQSPLSFEALHASLGFSRSTLYRYLKALGDAGLATSLHESDYVLGPRVAELDRAMRLNDPLITAARPVMAALASELDGIALLCRRYRDRVLCVHQDGTIGRGVRSTYERGAAMPLFRGAASRVILARLPGPMVAKLQAAHAAEFAAAGLGADMAEARAALRAIRRRGWDMTQGQVTAGVTGIAAPLIDARGVVLGSLSVTMARTDLSPDGVEAMAGRIAAEARRISAQG